MDAIINLSHFIGHQGKEKAKFTEITNIFDSRSPIHDILKNGQGHGLILSNKQYFCKARVRKLSCYCLYGMYSPVDHGF